MVQHVTEESGVQNEWYADAKDMTVDRLPEFIRRLTEDYRHDYRTICHAVAAAAVGAARAVNNNPVGGITGFQAGEVMWKFISHWMSGYKGKPLRLVNYADMLYPQYEDEFSKVISKGTCDYLVEQARRNLEEHPHANQAVLAHWARIAAGEMPFGYRVEKD